MNTFMVGFYSFIITIVLGGIMLLYFLYENYNLNKFNHDFYNKGIEKINLTEPIKTSEMDCNTNDILKTKKGIYKFFNKRECHFRVKKECFKNQYFPGIYRGIIKTEDQKIKLIGKVSIIPYTVMVMSSLGFIIVGFTMYSANNSIFLLLFPIVAISYGIFLLNDSFKKEKRLFMEVYNEIKNIIVREDSM